MSLAMVLDEEEFYKTLRRKCIPITDILPLESESVFVKSFRMFWKDYSNHINTRDDFKKHCRFLENARQAYVYGELGDHETGSINIDGNIHWIHVCETLEEVCVYIETYLEETLFGP